MNDFNRELTRFNVISSRIRLARNVEGICFPRSRNADPVALREVVTGAARAAEGLIDFNLYRMCRLGAVEKRAMVERHLISPAHSEDSGAGALILEKNESIAVMLNEEDHIREQCVVGGFDLEGAFRRLDEYDDRLLEVLPVAFDSKLGFLTACPTNLGTGMRASTMLFLPALKLAGAIESALTKFIRCYGLTIRGVYGEGSAAEGDMYQLSNTRSLGLDESDVIRIVEAATIELCDCERAARERLVSEKGGELRDRIRRSYGLLTNAYRLSSSELMRLISDVKLGVILQILPFNDIKRLDQLLVLCSAANLTLLIGEHPPELRDEARAKLVSNILATGRQRR